MIIKKEFVFLILITLPIHIYTQQTEKIKPRYIKVIENSNKFELSFGGKNRYLELTNEQMYKLGIVNFDDKIQKLEVENPPNGYNYFFYSDKMKGFIQLNDIDLNQEIMNEKESTGISDEIKEERRNIINNAKTKEELQLYVKKWGYWNSFLLNLIKLDSSFVCTNDEDELYKPIKFIHDNFGTIVFASYKGYFFSQNEKFGVWNISKIFGVSNLENPTFHEAIIEGKKAYVYTASNSTGRVEFYCNENDKLIDSKDFEGIEVK